MALIDTNPKCNDLDNKLRLACADELGAQTLYREMLKFVESKQDISFEVKEQIVERLKEVIKDEEEHVGILLYCINLVNPETTENMNNGVKGA